MQNRVALFVFAAVLAAPFAAQAEPREVVVHYGDLDLTRTADAAIMAERLDAAAREACGSGARLNSVRLSERLEERRAFEACHAEAVNRAMRALDEPAVTQAYADHVNQRSS